MDSSTNLLPSEAATIRRILANPSVEGIIIINERGQLQYTSLDNNITFPVSSKLLFLADKAREMVRDLHPTDDLLTLRIRTQSKEMIVITSEDDIQVIAIQKIQSIASTVQPTEKESKDSF